MNFEGNFRSFGRLDASALRLCVERQPQEAWNEDEFRQNLSATHADTQSLLLIFDKDFRHANPTRLARYGEFSEALRPFIERISAHVGPDGCVVRCILTKLRSGGLIAPHIDRGYSLTQAHRCHIAIKTSPDVSFFVGDETIHMKPGEIWEINNTRRHGAANQGAEDRVHLILDWARPIIQVDLERRIVARRQRHMKV